MSYHLQTGIKENCVSDEKVVINPELHQLPLCVVAPIHPDTTLVVDKHHSLVEIANNTVSELYKTLENQQTKLLELEERRKKIQEEMLLLKAEIEEEKQSFKLNIKQSVAENLSILNKSSENEIEDINLKKLITSFEGEEEQLLFKSNNINAKNSRKVMEESDSAGEHSQNMG